MSDDGLLAGPVFPGASVQVAAATTRGHLDTDKFVGSAPASFEPVRAFYEKCPGTWSEIAGARAFFARQYDGDWRAGKGRVRVDAPEQMSDRVVLTEDGERTHLEIVVAFPSGRGRPPIAEARSER